MGFVPSAARGQQLNRGMQADLLGSLLHLAEAGPAGLQEALHPAMERLSAGQSLGPEAFGLYFQLGEHLLLDEPEPALAVAHRLAACPARPDPGGAWCVRGRGSLEARTLDAILDARLGEEADAFHPLGEVDVQAFEVLLRAGRELLAEGLPALHGELTAIVSDVLLAQAPPGARYEFDGASHYQFWGLLLLNPRHHRDRLAVAEVLAHESGHSVLFGMCREQALIENADDELYPSPLREDPRPMDGIVHATYVSARMAWAMEGLASSGCLNDAEHKAALLAAADDRRRFQAGFATVCEHARLTPLGREVMEDARGWVG